MQVAFLFCPNRTSEEVDVMSDIHKSMRWKKKREQILRRDNYLCQDCKRYGKRVDATEVHHIKHVDEYPELAFQSSNLISLCAACHNKRHPEKGKKKRYPPG